MATRTNPSILLIAIIPIFIMLIVAVVYNQMREIALSANRTSPRVVQQAKAEEVQVPPDDDSKRYNLDATQVLTMTKVYEKNNAITYTFFVGDVATGKKQQLFTKTITGIGSMSIPFNSWSPDNSYVYISDVERGVTHILVFKVSGEDMSPGQKYVDVFEQFAKRNLGYTYKEVTGWASGTLLIVNTNMSDTPTRGPSFWFEVTDNAFIQLATRF